MRTTLNIDDGLMRRVRQIAAERNQTLTQVIEEILRQAVSGQRLSQQQFKLNWITVAGRIQPGVDLSDRDALLEVMEDRP